MSEVKEDEKKLRVIMQPNPDAKTLGEKILVMDRTDLTIPPFNMEVTYMDLKKHGCTAGNLYVDMSKDYAVIRSEDGKFAYPTRIKIKKQTGDANPSENIAI